MPSNMKHIILANINVKVYSCILTLFNYFLFMDCVYVLLPFDGE